MKRLIIAFAGLACLTCAALADTAKPVFGAWGVDLTGMDTSVKPGDDFFSYANGTWYKNAVIPADRSSNRIVSGSADPEREAHGRDRGRARSTALRPAQR